MESVSLSRRGFLAASAAAGFLQAKPVYFTEAEASLIVLIAEQIIPADQGPGATQAGVVQYIDRQLAGLRKRLVPVYREGLPAFEPLRNMPFPEQTKFLEAVERGEHGRPAAELFNLMIDHTMQGFYGSPKHGGNKDEASWRMLGVVDEMGGGHH